MRDGLEEYCSHRHVRPRCLELRCRQDGKREQKQEQKQQWDINSRSSILCSSFSSLLSHYTMDAISKQKTSELTMCRAPKLP
jgi:hypothetical protein